MLHPLQASPMPVVQNDDDDAATVASLKTYLWSIIYMPSSLRYIMFMPPSLRYIMFMPSSLR